MVYTNITPFSFVTSDSGKDATHQVTDSWNTNITGQLERKAHPLTEAAQQQPCRVSHCHTFTLFFLLHFCFSLLCPHFCYTVLNQKLSGLWIASCLGLQICNTAAIENCLDFGMNKWLC